MKITVEINAPLDQPGALTNATVQAAVERALCPEIITHIQSITVTVEPA